MSGDRFVVLGAARAQSPWFGAVARWATTAALPIEFEKAVSAEELRARLTGGRRYSAVLVDAGLTGWDRDLAALARARRCAVVVVATGPAAGRARDLGADAVLDNEVTRAELLTTLQQVAEPVARVTDTTAVGRPPVGTEVGWRGRLVAVTGAGGVGRSTLAMGLVAGLARDPRERGLVVLADLALHAQQGLLHDAGDVVPGLSELVEAHRVAHLGADEVRDLCFHAAGRGYDLLLGLRRHRDWSALRPAAVAAALDQLRCAYRLVVADVDAEVDGEAECGSTEVEERNVLARQALGAASLVLVVGMPTLPGIHAQVRVLRDLLAYGVPSERLVAVVNRAPRWPGVRAKLARDVAGLLELAAPQADPVVGPVFVGERRGLDDVVRDGAPLSPTVVDPLAATVTGLLDLVGGPAVGPSAGWQDGPVAVVPGSLGSWAELAELGGEER